MINQTWFMQDNMQCVADNAEQELYYDKNNGCFYLVAETEFDKLDKRDRFDQNVTREYTSHHVAYPLLMRIKEAADRTGESQAFSFKYETGRFEFYEDEDDE